MAKCNTSSSYKHTTNFDSRGLGFGLLPAPILVKPYYAMLKNKYIQFEAHFMCQQIYRTHNI